MQLPPKHEHLRVVVFGRDERTAYDKLRCEAKAKYERLKKNFSKHKLEILQLLCVSCQNRRRPSPPLSFSILSLNAS